MALNIAGIDVSAPPAGIANTLEKTGSLTAGVEDATSALSDAATEAISAPVAPLASAMENLSGQIPEIPSIGAVIPEFTGSAAILGSVGGGIIGIIKSASAISKFTSALGSISSLSGLLPAMPGLPDVDGLVPDVAGLAPDISGITSLDDLGNIDAITATISEATDAAIDLSVDDLSGPTDLQLPGGGLIGETIETLAASVASPGRLDNISITTRALRNQEVFKAIISDELDIE